MAELKATVLKNLPLAKASLQFRVLQHPSLGNSSLESVLVNMDSRGPPTPVL